MGNAVPVVRPADGSNGWACSCPRRTNAMMARAEEDVGIGGDDTPVLGCIRPADVAHVDALHFQVVAADQIEEVAPVRKHVRPADGCPALALVGLADDDRVAAGFRHARDRGAALGGKDDVAARAPRGAQGPARRRQRLRRPTGDAHLLQLVADEVAKPSAVGREERVVGSLRVGQRLRLHGVEPAEVQQGTGGVEDGPSVTRNRQLVEGVERGRHDREPRLRRLRRSAHHLPVHGDDGGGGGDQHGRGDCQPAHRAASESRSDCRL